MATVKLTGIRAVPTVVEHDVLIVQYDPALESVVGPNPTHALLLSTTKDSAKALFHHGCIYLASRNELWTTSAPLPTADQSRTSAVLMSKVTITTDPRSGTLTAEWAKIRPPRELPMPASGCAAGGNGTVWCSQGTVQSGTGGVFHMPAGRPPIPLVTSYYGRDFNSPYSAAVSGGTVWFTDPCCGHELDFRPQPQLPPSVYRYDLETREVRAVADGFIRPTGIAVDEGSSTLYVSEAGGVKVDGTLDLAQPRSIYAFDIIERGGSVFLANKRLFALARRGAPMHLMFENGNLWAACGDGIEIWSSGGSLLGFIRVTGNHGASGGPRTDGRADTAVGGVLSFCRGPDNSVFVCAQQTLWRLHFPPAPGGSVASPIL
ncbi:SMP-30/Gluconolaconase/LRE-like region containing protein [Colletotrichum musicola]|uniref:SMP-30/Gluconolaconase/LRE-like region containing protein n=1 Tax=Colletotrichum musicola TaxID=2175873 RepID=A0A8H6U7C0_9PEZI|nr:SMP-30/Gluconolaconase/LRE-like region containing protein [Colletotrichum musicola]